MVADGSGVSPARGVGVGVGAPPWANPVGVAAGSSRATTPVRPRSSRSVATKTAPPSTTCRIDAHRCMRRPAYLMRWLRPTGPVPSFDRPRARSRPRVRRPAVPRCLPLARLSGTAVDGAGGWTRDGARTGGDHRRRRRRHVDRLPPDRARLDGYRPRRPRRADLRVHVPLGRPGRPAARLRDPDPDDDVRGGAVPAPAAQRRAWTRRGTRSARSAWRRRPPAWRSWSARPAGRRRSACRWSSSRPGEAQDRFPLMSTDGVLGGGLAADRRLAGSVRPRPAPWPPALGRAARRSGPHTRVVAIGVELGPTATPRVTGVTVEHRGEREEIRADVVVNAGGMFAPEIGRMAGVTVPDHPDGPPVPVHRGDRGRPRRPAPAARPGQPRLLPGGGRRAVHGRLRARSGAVVARWRPGRLQRQAPGAGHAPLRADHGRRHPAGPGDGRGAGQPGHQRPGGLHAGQRVHPRRVGGPRLLGRGRVLGPRDRGRRWASGARWRAGSSTASRSWTSGRWTSAGSGRPTGRSATRWRARSRTTRPTTTSTTPTRSARPAARCGPSPTYEAARAPRRGRSARSPAGSARTGSSPMPTTAGGGRAALEALRPRGWAGQHWSPAIARGGARDAHGRRACSTRARSRSWR